MYPTSARAACQQYQALLQVPTACASVAPPTSYKAGVTYISADIRKWLNKGEGPGWSAWRCQCFVPDAFVSVEEFVEALAKARSMPWLRFEYQCNQGDYVIAMVNATFEAEVWWVGRVQRVTATAVYINFLSKYAGLHPVI